MKICRPIKHLPKGLRKLYKLFLKYSDIPQFQSFIIEEINYYGHTAFARELQEKQIQKSLRKS